MLDSRVSAVVLPCDSCYTWPVDYLSDFSGKHLNFVASSYFVMKESQHMKTQNLRPEKPRNTFNFFIYHSDLRINRVNNGGDLYSTLRFRHKVLIGLICLALWDRYIPLHCGTPSAYLCQTLPRSCSGP